MSDQDTKPAEEAIKLEPQRPEGAQHWIGDNVRAILGKPKGKVVAVLLSEKMEPQYSVRHVDKDGFQTTTWINESDLEPKASPTPA